MNVSRQPQGYRTKPTMINDRYDQDLSNESNQRSQQRKGPLNNNHRHYEQHKTNKERSL